MSPEMVELLKAVDIECARLERVARLLRTNPPGMPQGSPESSARPHLRLVASDRKAA